MSAKHTPGPWSVHRSNMVSIQDAKNQGIAQPLYPFAGASEEFEDQFQANARLIAASPDFEAATAYLVLSAVVDGKYWDANTIEWAKQMMHGEQRTGAEIVHAAIAKATGKEEA